MSYFLFIDESGQDHKESPYEVLAGIAIQDHDLWNLVNALHNAEIRHFGRRYSAGKDELKAKKILKTKVFQHASLNVEIDNDEIPILAKLILDDGGKNNTVKHMKALAIAKLNYTAEVFELCHRYRCKAFASIVEPKAQQTESNGLRKDYGYLFERFFYFLEDKGTNEQGIVVFDELEKSQSHILIDQAHRYFKETATGRLRSSLIIPEPFFVHSELTTGVQIADLIAYVISWGFRTSLMTRPKRSELDELTSKVAGLRYKTKRDRNGGDIDIWSFSYIDDLRTKIEKGYIE